MKADRYFGISKRIVEWKEVSEFEEILSKAAEDDRLARHLYVEYYRLKNEIYFEKGRSLAYDLLQKDQDIDPSEDLKAVYDDMVYCLHRYGLSFQDYCIYGLHNKSEYCRKQFVSDKLRYHYCDLLNAPEVYEIMTDKYLCYTVYKPFFKREVVPVLSESDKDNFLRFVKNNHDFIYKPLEDHSGHGVELIHADKINPSEWFDDMIANHRGIVEEVIKQGDPLNKLNSHSVNTCRVETFTIGDEVYIMGATLRMGVGDSIKDNAGSGGIYASVDPETGILQSDAKNYHNQHYLFHPNTKCQILGFKLPDWDEAKALIQAMSTHRDGTTLIAWDIAYSNNGWCMVEANDNGDWGILQSNLQKGKKEALYRLMDKFFNT